MLKSLLSNALAYQGLSGEAMMSVGFHPSSQPTRSGDRIKLKVERDRTMTELALVRSAKGEQIVQSSGADTRLAEIGLHLKQ
jgi:hypothetical protein